MAIYSVLVEAIRTAENKDTIILDWYAHTARQVYGWSHCQKVSLIVLEHIQDLLVDKTLIES